MKHRRKRRKKPMKITRWFKALSMRNKALLIAGVALVCLILAGVIYVASIFGKLNTEEIKEEDIHVNELDESVGVGYTNFALFGSDSREGNVTRDLNTDTIIIVSLNNETKEVKMVSVYRDTLLDMTNGKIQKCNSAYARGGATQAINMLNMNLDLDIKKYVTVDLSAVADLVDMIGGVEVDVTEKEMKALNAILMVNAQTVGKNTSFLTRAGLQTLDGAQATAYARIRKGVGNDYARTERQRIVIQKVVEKAIRSDFSTINKIINTLFPRIATNFTLTEVLSYAKSFAKYKITETTGFPFEKGSGVIPGKGDSVYPITLKKNVTMLHKFLYGTEDYIPSAKVQNISAEIAEIVGNRKVDPPVTTTPGDDTTTGDGDNTTTGDGDDTTTGDGDDITTGDGDDITTGDGDDTTTGDGDDTTTGDGDDITTGDGDDTTTGDGDDTTTGDGDDTPTGGGTQTGGSTPSGDGSGNDSTNE